MTGRVCVSGALSEFSTDRSSAGTGRDLGTTSPLLAFTGGFRLTRPKRVQIPGLARLDKQ